MKYLVLAIATLVTLGACSEPQQDVRQPRPIHMTGNCGTRAHQHELIDAAWNKVFSKYAVRKDGVDQTPVLAKYVGSAYGVDNKVHDTMYVNDAALDLHQADIDRLTVWTKREIKDPCIQQAYLYNLQEMQTGVDVFREINEPARSTQRVKEFAQNLPVPPAK